MHCICFISSSKKQITLDHSYATQEEPETVHRKEVNINPKYADDCSYMTTAHARFEQQEKTSQERLHKYHLNINRTKTERFTVPEPLPPPTKPKINLIQWSDLDWTLPSNTETPTPAWKNM